MITSITEVTRAKADAYVQQMCKHFAHKADVTHVKDAQVIRFGFGTGELRAVGGRIVLSAHAKDRPQLERIETVLGSHLERFAFRERLIVTWPQS
ncbi:DUF2218 domain-containing protein [Ruegeria conchae]|uniref:DUF2218 domain-containing protein n=1 Tax=Ruegeria conchae TaxID=981384 RepID=UPI001480612F|nr:DUF2218 domain-containing protein [Ruegeria conchae]UWR01958.1 DUF2218 domain-containing protein [Ruegeria conchae]